MRNGQGAIGSGQARSAAVERDVPSNGPVQLNGKSNWTPEEWRGALQSFLSGIIWMLL